MKHDGGILAQPPDMPYPKTGPMTKTLENTSVEEVKRNVPDVKIIGNGDTFRLLCKASSREEGWMKSCKAMEIPGVGCVVQVTTQQGDNVAEALVFVPGVQIEDDVSGGRKLVKMT